jgi:hypothetical protein
VPAYSRAAIVNIAQTGFARERRELWDFHNLRFPHRPAFYRFPELVSSGTIAATLRGNM